MRYRVSKFSLQVRRRNRSCADCAQIFVVDITVPQKRHRRAEGTGPLDTGESGCSNHPKKDRCQLVDTGWPLTFCPNWDSGEQKWRWPGDTLGLRDVLDVHPDVSRVLKVERMSLYSDVSASRAHSQCRAQ